MITKQSQTRRKGSKTTSIKTLDRKLWKLFSLYTRQRWAVDGIAVCVTCGRRGHWKEMHAGHFQNRRFKSTKFNEKNVQVQCVTCNSFNEGEQFKFSQWLDKKYGPGTSESLYTLSRVSSKLTRMWYEQMIEEYTEKLRIIRGT